MLPTTVLSTIILFLGLGVAHPTERGLEAVTHLTEPGLEAVIHPTEPGLEASLQGHGLEAVTHPTEQGVEASLQGHGDRICILGGINCRYNSNSKLGQLMTSLPIFRCFSCILII